MVDFSLSQESQLLAQTVRRFVDEELAPHEALIEAEERVPKEIADAVLGKSKALGLYALNMPEEVGGGGLSVVDTCLVEEQFGWTSEALIRRAFGAVPAGLMACRGDQRERYLLPAVRGEIIVGFAMSEPDSGSDAAGIRTRAERTPGGYLLSGSKHFISDADVADVFIVTAVTDRDKGKKGISTFLVDARSPGLAVGPVQRMMGLHGVNHCPVYFDNVHVPSECLLGAEGDGLAVALGTSNRVRLGGVGARSCGIAERLLRACLDYSKQRKQFGEPISNFQMIQAMLADIATDIYATRMMVLNAAWELDQGHDAREKVSMVKLRASEMLGRAADLAVQIFGGMGYCSEMPIERIYRDARVLRIFDGTSEIHRIIIARSLLSSVQS